MSFRLKVTGVNRVGNKFRRLASFHPKVTNPAGRKWAQAKSKQLRQFPYPQPPLKYKRTGLLGRMWRALNPKPGIWSIVNLARRKGRAYARWVVGDEKGQGQAPIHKNRWWVARKIIEETAPTLTKELTEALRKVINE